MQIDAKLERLIPIVKWRHEFLEQFVGSVDGVVTTTL